MKTVIEPFRIRMIEPLVMTTREERERLIREAGFNPFQLPAEGVLIDLVTDSGTSALSTRQWSGMLGADESFTGSRSFYRFRNAVRELFGHEFILPCHQGRAAENLISRALLAPGDIVLANTLFSTTRANVEAAGAEGRDLPIPEATDRSSLFPFKGNIDIAGLERSLASADPGKVRFVVLTVTDNSRGGQPVALSNIEAAADACRRYKVPLLLDAARFAENAFLIKLKEPAYKDWTPRDIARKMFDLVDGVFMSLKKDGLGNSGGLMTFKDQAWFEKVRVQLLITEGVPSAGGLAGRDLESLAAALDEMLDESYLDYRIASTARLGRALDEAGVPVIKPFGAHAIYIDGRAFCPHLSDEHLPAWSLSVALYVESGVRTWETGNVMRGRYEAASGKWTWPDMDLMRLAVPRRVYTQSQLDYAAEAVIELYGKREAIRGLRYVYRPAQLPQFVATFEPV